MEVKVEIASYRHAHHAEKICQLIAASARERGIGRGKRHPDIIRGKMKLGLAIISFCGEELAGFSYLDTWEDESFVVNTGLIVIAKFRFLGIAKRIKTLAIQLASKKYPNAKMISLTTGLQVMKMNYNLGYQPVTYSELPTTKKFWKGCESCPNFKHLKEKDYKMCFCTAMILSNLNRIPFPDSTSNNYDQQQSSSGL